MNRVAVVEGLDAWPGLATYTTIDSTHDEELDMEISSYRGQEKSRGGLKQSEEIEEGNPQQNKRQTPEQ
ncbi:hypothetical protein HJFPF1_02689 [Paramyrothecium foliicola]|nr:hypothetical protein HJFPF1_02689 [Paramyrothecium foliicola]